MTDATSRSCPTCGGALGARDGPSQRMSTPRADAQRPSRCPGRLAALAVVSLAPLFASREARAQYPMYTDEIHPIGHVAYGVGGALGERSGFRRNLDLSLGA